MYPFRLKLRSLKSVVVCFAKIANMEFTNAGARSVRLLSEEEGLNDLSNIRPGDIVDEAMQDINTIKIEWAKHFEIPAAVSLGLLVLIAGAALFGLFVHEWAQETSYRAWFLLACVAPLSFAANETWNRVQLIWGQWGSIQVLVDSMRAATLFNAVADRIEEVAESKAETCSSNVESFTMYDKTLGKTQIRMRFWGKESHTVHLKLAGNRSLAVTFSRGDDVICGRDHSVKTRESLIIRMRSSNDRLADKKFLKDWLLSCVEWFKEPPENVVEVIALDQTSTDWIPEWQTRCVRPLKQSNGTGNGFFLKRKSIMPILSDAFTWSGKELRIYLILGPPGVGKTELTIWLAGYLRVPLYRLSLNDSRLSDQIFAQLVSPKSLQHDNAVIQIDEFQETLARWEKGYTDKGVSMGGFCEVLQGSNSLARGFIVLSGSLELGKTMQDPFFAAVFRRISIAPTKLDWLSSQDLKVFVLNFVRAFLPHHDEEELNTFTETFVRNDGPWWPGKISIDMAKQFLMHRISSFRATQLSEATMRPGTQFVVPVEMRANFLDYLCEDAPAVEHLKVYPRVDQLAKVVA